MVLLKAVTEQNTINVSPNCLGSLYSHVAAGSLLNN